VEGTVFFDDDFSDFRGQFSVSLNKYLEEKIFEPKKY